MDSLSNFQIINLKGKEIQGDPTKDGLKLEDGTDASPNPGEMKMIDMILDFLWKHPLYM